MMFFKRYTSLLISTSLFVQSVSPTFAIDHDSVEQIKHNLTTLKKFNSTPAPLNFASDSEKTAAGVLHWAKKNGEVYVLLGKRDDSKNQDIGEWCNFGGKSDAADEGLTNTAEREVREELNGIYAHHPRLLCKQPVTALYFPDKKDGLLHYMYWQQVQYLEPEIFNKKVNEATEGHSKEYTDFMWVKASDLFHAVVTHSPRMAVEGKSIEIFSPLFATLSTEAGQTFLHELATHKKIRRFNKDVRPFCNRLYVEKDQNEPTAEIIPGKGISIHWDLPHLPHKPQATLAEAIPFGQNGFGKWHAKRQIIGPDGEIISETPVFFNQQKEEDIFAEAVAAHGMAMVELKRRFQPTERPRAEPSDQWNPNCEETLSRIHLRIVLGPDYKTPADFMTDPNSRRAADLANIRSYFKIDDTAEYEQKGNEFKREIKLVDSDYEFFADILGWEDENKQWPTFYHGASANLNNLFKAFTYLRELIDMRSFNNLMALRGTDIYFKNDKTVWDMLNRTGDNENSETSPAMLFLNFVLLAGLKTTRTTSSSAEYVLNDHSVTEQNIAERFEEAMALAGFSKPEYAYFQSVFEQFIAHKNPTAGNSVMLAISQNPKKVDNYNYPTIGGSYYDPAHYNLEKSSKSSATSAEEPSGSSDSKAEKLEKQTNKPQPIKSTLQILKGIQDEFERQQKDGIEPFTTNTPDKKSLFPENRVFLHPSHLMDPTHNKTKAFDRFPLTKAEQKAHDQEMRRITVATMADWLAQKTAVMEGSFITEPVLKKLYKVAHRGMTHQEVTESPSHDCFLYLVRSGHFEAVQRYLTSYPEILKLVDPTKLANASLESKDVDQINYFLHTLFQGNWKVFLQDNFKNKHGQTPLHLAVEAKLVELVKAFLESGLIDPNIQDNKGNTPLQQAISWGDNAMVEPFLSHPKVDINALDEYGDTPLLYAMKIGQKDVAKFLCSHPEIDLNIPNRDKQTPLLIAVCTNKELAEFFLTNDNVDPNIPEASGMSPLSAAIYGDRSIIPLLLAHNKINPNIILEYGETHLSKAISCNDQELVKLLLACDKVDPNLADSSSGDTPLSQAMLSYHQDIIQLLLAHEKCDPNIKVFDGYSALHVAVLYGSINMVELLLQKRANLSTQDGNGQIPLDLALSAGFNEIAELLHQEHLKQAASETGK